MSYWPQKLECLTGLDSIKAIEDDFLAVGGEDVEEAERNHDENLLKLPERKRTGPEFSKVSI